jgi:hypothetical protein
MNTAPWKMFDYSSGSRGKGHRNGPKTRQARVNSKRYHIPPREE